ncbi:MAG TPA: SPOR domain-containing protein [Deltaproteobacteria bacterium]|nr:SPOR domain-containing protein [Deltaproteobacteria bacterium]HOM28964.1 SPOR domain-containing protein [Deltaproteobacteria bacterium]HPP81062.1 SPOR domain-containing protein [Deltaproteobacteria bacterium]
MRGFILTAAVFVLCAVCPAAWAGYGLSNVVEKTIAQPDSSQAPPTSKPQAQEAPPAQPGAKQAPQEAKPASTATAPEPLPTPAKKPAITYEKTAFYPYTIHISSWQSKKDALNHMQRLSGELEGVFVTKIDLGPTGLWYRVDYGVFENDQQAGQTMAELKTKGVLRNDPFIGSPVPYAIEIGVFPSKDAASAEASRLIRKGVSTYVVKESEAAYRLLSGAYHDRKSAEPALADLAALGIRAKTAKR